MSTRFKSDGTVYADDANGTQYRVPSGIWLFGDDGSLARYQYGQGMQGFWSSLGSGFSSVGKWVGNHFGTIATVGLGAYALRTGLPIGQPGPTSAQAAQAQAAANAAARAQSQAQTAPSFDLMSILPYAAIGLALYLVIGRKSG